MKTYQGSDPIRHEADVVRSVERAMNARLPVGVRLTRRFNASPQRVFDAWLDPQKAIEWIAAASTNGAPGEMVRIDIDARVGGSFSIVERRDGAEIEYSGGYLEIDRPELLVFTFSMGSRASDEPRVIVEIFPQRGGCELTLAHVGVRPDQATLAERGWARMLDRLAAALGHGSGHTRARNLKAGS